MDNHWNKLSEKLPEKGKKIIMMIKSLNRQGENYNVSLRVVSRRNAKKLSFNIFAEARITRDRVEDYIEENKHFISRMFEPTGQYFDFMDSTDHVLWRETPLLVLEEENDDNDSSILDW